MQRAPSTQTLDVDDASLVTAYRAGDAAAFDNLFERHYPDLVRYLNGRLQDEAAAEDVAQDTMIRAMRAIDRFDCDRPLGPWLRQIARNASIDLLRARGRAAAMSVALQHLEPVQQTAADQGSGDLGEIDLLRRALGDVPDRQRQALVRCYVEGWRPSEAAADFGVGSNAFEQLLHRARANLRRAYLRHDGQDRAAGLIWTLLAVAVAAPRRVMRLVHVHDVLPAMGQVVASGVVAASLTVGGVLASPAAVPQPAPAPDAILTIPGPASPASPTVPTVREEPTVPATRPSDPRPSTVDSGPPPPSTTSRPAPVALEQSTAEEEPAPADVPLPGDEPAGADLAVDVPSGDADQPDPDRVSTADPEASEEGVPGVLGGCGSVVREAVCDAGSQMPSTLGAKP